MTVEELRPLDRTFHAAIAAAAGNPLLGELHVKVLDAVFASPPFDTMLRRAAGSADEARILATSARSHTAIAERSPAETRRGGRRRPGPPRRRRGPPAQPVTVAPVVSTGTSTTAGIGCSPLAWA